MGDSPDVKTVAVEFIKSYYPALVKPDSYRELVEFYAPGAFISTTASDQTIVGAEAIAKEISDRFNELSSNVVKIPTVLYQPSISGSVIVTAVCVVEKDGRPTRRFVQTFYLVRDPHSQTKHSALYFIQNDILNWINDAPAPVSPQNQANGVSAVEAGDAHHKDHHAHQHPQHQHQQHQHQHSHPHGAAPAPVSDGNEGVPAHQAPAHAHAKKSAAPTQQPQVSGQQQGQSPPATQQGGQQGARASGRRNRGPRQGQQQGQGADGDDAAAGGQGQQHGGGQEGAPAAHQQAAPANNNSNAAAAAAATTTTTTTKKSQPQGGKNQGKQQPQGQGKDQPAQDPSAAGQQQQPAQHKESPKPTRWSDIAKAHDDSQGPAAAATPSVSSSGNSKPAAQQGGGKPKQPPQHQGAQQHHHQQQTPPQQQQQQQQQHGGDQQQAGKEHQQPQQQQQQPRQQGNRANRHGFSLYVKSLGKCTKESVEAVFNRYGKVKSSTVKENMGFAYIDFDEPFSKMAEILAEHQRRPIEYEGRPLFVEERKEQPPRSGRGGRSGGVPGGRGGAGGRGGRGGSAGGRGGARSGGNGGGGGQAAQSHSGVPPQDLPDDVPEVPTGSLLSE